MSRISFLLSIISLLFATLPSVALNPEFYASSSVLGDGKWVKVQVKETGIQCISNSTLRSLGFTNPDKVNVYGYGGRMLPESLDGTTPDDLPPLVSLHTPSGIVFFGHSSVRWDMTSAGALKFSHTSNPYSDNSFYFLSDKELERPKAENREEIAAVSDSPLTVFTERLLHEQDILAPSNTGRVILGEDFRIQNTRNFTFNLPDNTGDALVRVNFGAKTTNGSSSLTFSANGEQLQLAETDRIAGVNNSETFLNLRSTTKYVQTPGERLNLTIGYSHTGVLFTAALDYIEVEYDRKLSLRNEELYFYLAPSQASEVILEGCSEKTVLWDVSDPVRPTLVSLSLSGGKGTFVTPAGLHEYVAFNPEKVVRAAVGAGAVHNQNLHSMEAPGMLVVAPSQFYQQALRLADLHAKTDGLSVAVVRPEEVYNEFSSGTPDVTAFRRLLKMWFDRAGGEPEGYTRYCLLFSRPTYDNKMGTPNVKRAGYPRIPIWQDPVFFTESGSYSTDDYIGMLDDNPTPLNMGNATIHVAVGRMPVKSASEANNAINKLENYLLNPNLGAWRNNVMVIADDQDNGQHLTQAENVVEAMRSGENGKNLIYEKLYLDSYPLRQSGQGPVYPEAKQRMLDKIAEGVALIDYIGHASPRGWGHENLLTWPDLTSFTNTNLPFIYAATCEFLFWDADEVSGGEEMWLNPTSGVIGMICPSRKVYISSNGELNAATSAKFFSRDKEGNSLRLGEIMIEGKNARPGETNKLRYAFMGDPSMRLPSPALEATIDMINGSAEDSQEFPELQARSKVSLSGKIVDNNGNVADDFNGVIEIQLFDAEKVMETFGNGQDGVVMNYNDRKTRLYIGRAQAVNGLWETSFIMPSEIENNYTPAMVSLYGFDETGREANGATERLYVYGYMTDSDDDDTGPEITDFYLNSPSVAEGSFIGPSAILYATLSDPSGINLSEAGIGHKMTISLDGKEYYDDVNLYYTPDMTSFEKGSVAYPLRGISPGQHSITLTVWDTANNSSSATINFSVRADWKPSITTLTTDVSPASTTVAITVEVDGSLGTMPCLLEVFDLGGRKVWESAETEFSESKNTMTSRWDLHDLDGRRVARGIYLYRATVTTTEGHLISKTRKLAVTDIK